MRTLLFAVPVFFLLAGCGVGAAEDVAKKFHEKLDAGEYAFIVQNLIDPGILEETGEQQWVDLFEFIEERWGKVSSREKDTGFESHYDDGITSVKLDYTAKYGEVTVYERLYLADYGDGFKVTGILVNESKSDLERQSQDF